MRESYNLGATIVDYDEMELHGYRQNAVDHLRGKMTIDLTNSWYTVPPNYWQPRKLTSHHGWNSRVVTMRTTPQFDVSWIAPVYYPRRGGVRPMFVRFRCAPVVAEALCGDDHFDKVYLHDPTVYIQLCDGLIRTDFSTQTAAGPRFWSRFLRQETAAARRHPIESLSAAVSLQNKEQLLWYRFLVQSIAAYLLQRMARAVKYRWLLRRAQRRRLFKRIMLRPSPPPLLLLAAESREDEEASSLLLVAALWHLRTMPDVIMRKVLAFV